MRCSVTVQKQISDNVSTPQCTTATSTRRRVCSVFQMTVSLKAFWCKSMHPRASGLFWLAGKSIHVCHRGTVSLARACPQNRIPLETNPLLISSERGCHRCSDLTFRLPLNCAQRKCARFFRIRMWRWVDVRAWFVLSTDDAVCDVWESSGKVQPDGRTLANHWKPSREWLSVGLVAVCNK